MKKLFVLLLSVILMASVLLAGCGGTNEKPAGTSSSAPAASNAPAKTVEITFWHSAGGSVKEALEGLVNKFNSSQSEVKVTPVYQGNYYDTAAKIQAAIASAAPPDVSQIEIGRVRFFADAGALADLKPFISGKDGIDVNDFQPTLMSFSNIDGKVVSLPLGNSTPLLYFNKDQLKAAGLDENGPKTWDELKQFAEKLSIKDKRWGLECPIDSWFYEAMIFQNNGSILSSDGKDIGFNNEIGTAPINFWRGLIDEGAMKVPPGKEYNSWDVAKQDFSNQTVSMIYTSTGDLTTLLTNSKGKFELGTAFLPASKSYGVATGGSNIVMYNGISDEHKAAAWKFIKWLTDAQQTADFSKATGYLPTRKSAATGTTMQEYYKERPQFKTAVDQLQYVKPRPFNANYPEITNNIMMNAIQKAVMDRNYSPEQCVKDISEGAKKLLK